MTGMKDTDFWNRLDKAVPGMLDAGINIYGASAGRRENAGMIAGAQGPLYRQAMGQAGTTLDSANMDPRAAGAEWMKNQRSLLAGPDAADEDALFRRLHATGMLGAASYNPGVEGVTPSGTAMNPQMAAFYAARNARNAKMAADAQAHGEGMLDSRVARAGRLQGVAAGAQNTGMNAMNPATKTARGVNLLKGGASIAKDLGYGMKDVAGLFKSGADWLGDKTGWWNSSGPQLLGSGFNDLDWRDG
jgi:hypothetical protein